MPAIGLIKNHSIVLEIEGDTDYRLRTLESAAVYYLKRRRLPKPFMSSLKQWLAVNWSLKEIFISGRRVAVKGLAGGQIWFDFEQLCVNNRSSKDYIQIGNLYQTIFLENVPIFHYG